MKTLIVSAAAIAAAALFIPTPSYAQIGFGVPGFGVQVGGGHYGGYGGGPYGGYGGAPYYGGYGYQQQPYYGGYRPYGYGEGVVVQPRVYSDYDEPVVRRRVYRQRYVSMSGCRTVTIQRPDGAMRRVRRCS